MAALTASVAFCNAQNTGEVRIITRADGSVIIENQGNIGSCTANHWRCVHFWSLGGNRTFDFHHCQKTQKQETTIIPTPRLSGLSRSNST